LPDYIRLSLPGENQRNRSGNQAKNNCGTPIDIASDRQTNCLPEAPDLNP
jgi:hypothetical protein